MAEVAETFQEWGLGVITSILPDRIPATASPAGENSALYFVGGGQAVPGQRLGIEVRNRTAVTGSPILWGGYSYRTSDGTIRHLLIGDNGRIDRLNSDDTLTNISTVWTSGVAFPDFATANDLCFIVDGTNAKKLRGLTVENFGIVRPAAPGASSGGAGSMTGTYDVAITYVNNNTFHESSRSDATQIVLAANSLTVTWGAAPDAQVTHVRTYIRKPTLGPEFFQVAQTAIAAGTVTVDISDAAYQFLLLVGPDTVENDPPPSGIKYVRWHRSRLFVADGANIYYSKIDKPEAFDPEAFESVNPDDGQLITGLLPFSETKLLIIKRDSVWMLIGDDPNNWTVELVDAGVGGTSHRSQWQAEGLVGWWGEAGPVIYTGSSVVNIGQPTLAPTFGPSGVNTTYLDRIIAAPDTTNQRILYITPALGGDRLNQWHPYNYRLGVWEATRWQPMDAASIAVVEDTLGQPQVLIGNYAGQVFKVWAGTNDGVVSGTTATGTFIPAATSISTITASGFDTTGAGLIERYVYVQNSDLELIGKARIASNTATVLTLASNIDNLVIGLTYTFYVGGIDWYWDTKVSDFGSFYTKKRFYFLYTQITAAQATTTLRAELAFNYGAVGAPLVFSVTPTTIGGIWDVSEWDEAVFGSEGIGTSRTRIGRTAQAYKVRIRHLSTDNQVILRKIEVRADQWRDRR